MAKRDQLRQTRAGTVINTKSKKQESLLMQALVIAVDNLASEFPVEFRHETDVSIRDIVVDLRSRFPDVPFDHYFDNTSLRPDGGVLYLVDHDGIGYPVLISEAKRQGTNDARAREGLAKQARGNAIERLGKNLTGFRTMMLGEGIMPFVVFGEGCDFGDDSSILDRVTTLAMFGPLNRIDVVNLGDDGQFNRGSFFFREPTWTVDEMVPVLSEIGRRSIYYYFSKFGVDKFQTLPTAFA
jgi:type II restriction enzyme